jgi:hypothetical protein
MSELRWLKSDIYIVSTLISDGSTTPPPTVLVSSQEIKLPISNTDKISRHVTAALEMLFCINSL